jgi:hypothetical protein
VLASLGCARGERPQSLPPGTVVPRVVTLGNPEQSYALYLPSGYARERRWPVVFVFDPLARGERALGQFRHAEELHGFIVAASNNSRNGPWAPEMEAAEAMVAETRKDGSGFLDWLKTEPAFERLRSSADFQSLTDP